MSTILVIEDSEGQRAEVRAALEASGLFERVLEAGNGILGLKLLLCEAVDLVLCDLEMPGLDGEKLLRMKTTARDAEVPVPFVVLTAVTDPERRARLLRDGASDAITKPFHTADLIARIGLHLKLVQAQRGLVAKNQELHRLSTTDSLTGLSNRRHLDDTLALEFARSQRSSTSFAVAMIDIDHFKSVNDDYGHPAGDAVLERVAQMLRAIVRQTDCVARFGGEEFVAILVDNDLRGGSVFAERLREAIAAMKIGLEDGRSLAVTVSIGVSEWNPALTSPKQLVAQADEALYRAKESGRDCVCLYSGD